MSKISSTTLEALNEIELGDRLSQLLDGPRPLIYLSSPLPRPDLTPAYRDMTLLAYYWQGFKCMIRGHQHGDGYCPRCDVHYTKKGEPMRLLKKIRNIIIPYYWV
jgi:hypothetical protein